MTMRRLFASMLLVTALAAAAAAQQPPQEPTDEFVPVSELPPAEQMPSAPLVIAAYAFAWLALGAYVVSVARRLTDVQREVSRLEGELKRGNQT
jgi:CcmD family protein